MRLLDKHRSKTNKHDIIVPCSGGKDGSFVAHQLKFKYGMNPLCVTWSPIIPTKIGKINLKNFINTGFDHIMGKPKTDIYKKLTALSFANIGPFIYGQFNYPAKIALDNNISIMMYGENGEVEYGGDMKYAFKPYSDFKVKEKHYFSKFPLKEWEKYNIKKEDLTAFDAPPEQEIFKKKNKNVFFWLLQILGPSRKFLLLSKTYWI